MAWCGGLSNDNSTAATQYFKGAAREYYWPGMKLGKVIYLGKLNYIAQHFLHHISLQKWISLVPNGRFSSLWLSQGPKESWCCGGENDRSDILLWDQEGKKRGRTPGHRIERWRSVFRPGEINTFNSDIWTITNFLNRNWIFENSRSRKWIERRRRKTRLYLYDASPTWTWD